MQMWLREAALKTLGDDLGDDLQMPLADGSWLLDQHLSAAWQFFRWSLPGLNKAAVTFLGPDLVQAFTALADPSANVEGLGDAERLAAAELQPQRRAALEAKLQKDLYARARWTLLEICRQGSVQQLQYYDSLENEAEPNRRVAEFFVETLLPGLQLHPRRSAARQLKGSGQCGAFFLHWMEQSCSWRWLAAMAHCSNQGFQTAGSLQGSAKGAGQDRGCQVQACREESSVGSKAEEGCGEAEEERTIRARPCRYRSG